jgi:hypothetical protein
MTGQTDSAGRQQLAQPAGLPLGDLAPPLLLLPLVRRSDCGHFCVLLPEELHHGRHERDPLDGYCNAFGVAVPLLILACPAFAVGPDPARRCRPGLTRAITSRLARRRVTEFGLGAAFVSRERRRTGWTNVFMAGHRGQMSGRENRSGQRSQALEAADKCPIAQEASQRL